MNKPRRKVLATLGPLHKKILYGTTGFLWLTGAWWLYRPAPLWLKIHGAFAMIFLVVLGTLVIQHVPAGWRQADQRFLGGLLLLLCSLLSISGWGLYYIGDDRGRQCTSLFHSVAGVLLPLIIFLHVWFSRNGLPPSD